MNKQIIIGLTLVSLMVAGCSKNDSPAADEGQVQAVFKIESRADGTETLADECLRMFIADRRQEHDNTETLHCGEDWRIDLNTNSYGLSGMTAQWYKFAFVSVPNCAGVDGKSLFTVAEGADEKTCDFNKLAIDYAPVLEAQQTESNRTSVDKLDVWRAVMNRWLQPDQVLTENVTMQRLTGRLELNLGIPEDQFRAKVASIAVTLNGVPQKFLIHDEDEGQIITENAQNYTFTYTEIPWNTRQDYVVTLALPPHEVQAALVVTYKDDSIQQEVYPIVDSNKETVSIKANTKTTILFNGMETGEFEVRYAGFNENAVIDVDDEWNGWSEQTDGGE